MTGRQILNKVLEPLTVEQKVTDPVKSQERAASYERGKKDGLDEANRMYRAEMEKIRAGVSPLE